MLALKMKKMKIQSTRDELYKKNLENYKKFHSSSDSDSIISGLSTTSSIKKPNTVDNYLIRQTQPISYVQRKITTNNNINNTDSGDEYHSDKELSNI